LPREGTNPRMWTVTHDKKIELTDWGGKCKYQWNTINHA